MGFHTNKLLLIICVARNNEKANIVNNLCNYLHLKYLNYTL